MKNSLKNKLKTEYENLSEQPSQNVWGRIEAELENTQEKPEIKIPQKFSFWKVAAVALFFISVGLLLNQLMNNKIAQNEEYFVQKENIEKMVPEGNQQKSVSEKENHFQNSIPESTKIADHQSVNHLEKPIRKIKNPESETERIIFSEKTAIASKEDSPKSGKIYLVNEEKKIPVIKEQIKYVTAEDLLFEREASKSLKEQEKDTRKLGDIGVNIEKPKSVKILGITVYSEENK